MNLMKFVGGIAGVLLFNSITFAASDKPVALAGSSSEIEILHLDLVHELGSEIVKKELYDPIKLQKSQLTQEQRKTALTNAKMIENSGEKSALGLNWFINPKLSVTADYVTMHYKQYAIEVDNGKGSEDMSIFQTRIQLKF